MHYIIIKYFYFIYMSKSVTLITDVENELQKFNSYADIRDIIIASGHRLGFNEQTRKKTNI